MVSGISSFDPPKGWWRADVLIASLCINILALALPIIILQVYDRILPNAAVTTLTFLVLGVCIAIALEMVLRIARSAIVNAAGARFEHRAGLEAFSAILNADISAFQKEGPGGYLDRMQGLATVRDFYMGQVALLIVDLPFVIVFLALIWFIGGALVLLPMILLATLLYCANWAGNRVRTTLAARNEMDNRRYNFLIEVLNGVHTVKSMAMEPMMLRRYERLQDQSASMVYALGRLNSVLQGISSTFSQASIVCIVGFGSILVVDHTMTMGGLAACTMLAGRVLQPVLKAMNMWTKFQGVQIAEERFNQLFTLPQEQRTAKQTPVKIKGHIELHDVTIKYDGDESPIFENVSLEIKPGEMVGITGDNSSGKTTLLLVMMGLIKPQSGRILLDGQDIRVFDPVGLRRSIGLVPQNGALFNGTLLENLTMFQEGDARIRAVRVADRIGLTDFVARLPKGLETLLGESTINSFPKGIQQRIIFARALVNDPKVIFFDNANAGMDMQSDREVVSTLTVLKRIRTMVIVSHRPSLLAKCDRVLEIYDKRLVQRPPSVPQSVAPAELPPMDRSA